MGARNLGGDECSEGFFAVVGWYGCIIIAVITLMLAGWLFAKRRARPLSMPIPDNRVYGMAASPAEWLAAASIPDAQSSVGFGRSWSAGTSNSRSGGELVALASGKVSKPRILHTSQRCRHLAKTQAADLVSSAVCKTCARSTSGLV